MMQRGVLKSNNIRLLIIDESDEILSRGFSDQIQEITNILKLNNPKTQVCWFVCCWFVVFIYSII